MKNLKLRWLFYFVLLGLCLQAQVNNQFKLQLYLADQNGNIYVNRTIGLKISILKSENDFPIYSEMQVLTSDATGLLNIPIGAGTNSVGNIASFSQLTAGFIKIEYDPSGGSNYTRMLLQPLVSVPYASISNYALGLKGRGITGNHFADSSILAENLDFNPAKKEDVEVLKSWIDTYTNGSIPTLITYLSSPNVIDTAQILAIVSSDGGDSISEKGFVYSLTPNPTINNSRLKAGRGNANFSGVLKGLNASSTYHVRSYAMNRLGIGYGNPITITTASPVSSPTLTTTSASSILETSAKTGGNVTSDGGAAITERGVVYATSGIPSLSNSKVVAGTSGTGTYTVNLTGLTGSTKYYFRAYATNSAGTGYGSLDSFVTLTPVVLPTISTISASSILETSATTGGNVTSDGGATVTERGVVYAISGIPSLSNSKVVAGTTGTGTYTVNLTGLTGSTKYYFRAYATNSVGTGYGSLDSFVTLTPIFLPTLTTTSAGSILETSAVTGGNVTSDGGAAITERGVVYATSGLPSITDIKVVADTAGIDTFTVNLTGLTGSTKYYFRAYATNSAGTGYGMLDSFVTLTPVVLPTISTISASSILETSAITGGNVTSDGGATVTERGVVYATSGIPSLSNSKIVAGTSGTGTYTVNLTGLTGSTKYYFRAYATNSAGTGYGTLDSFVTLTPVVLPTVSTTSASSILATSAVTGGNVTSDGGATVTERGVVWSTSPTPTISLSTKTSNGGGKGSFTSSLTGLAPNTTYYVRAYATNSAGTAYGNELSFIEEKDLSSCVGSPTVTDIDNNTYKTVQIGTQCWMHSNLKVSKYRNGDTIPTGLSDGEWSRTTSGAYAIYNINNANDAIYGSLYNWHSVADNRGLCPTGWHVPTDNEWTILTTYLGGEKNAGGKMKSVGTAYWADPNIGATNESGFSAHGGSWVYNAGYFYPVSLYGRLFAYFWSATELDGLIAWPRLLSYTSGSLDRLSRPKSFGYSVRCLRDTAAAVPTLTTSAISSITSTTASGGGNITTDGGAPVTMRGVVWSTSPTPTISLSTKTSNGGGTGSFTSSLTGLAPNTTYYVRAYATNSSGTAYGNELLFKTTAAVAVPTLTTSAISSITSTTATGGGNITTDGGAPVTERGVVYATSGSPSITDNKVVADTAGIDTFTVNLTGLSSATTYYFRAYATNSAGTGYGSLDSFVTLTPVVLPTLTTTSASSILETSATTGGNVTSDGGATVTERGVVYTTSGIPSLSNSKIVAGTSGTGTYTVNLTGLTGSTTYYFRAYATNSAGTGYGTLDSMTTLINYCPSDTIMDIDGNVYNTVSIGSQCWTKENLRVTKYRDGTSIPTGLDDGTWLNTSTGAYAIYNNDPSNEAIYGKLYNWYAVVDPRALCPSGWHVPSDTEWTTLSDNLGGNIAGGKMKSTGTALWTAPNTGATNESGFTGLPGGYRNGGGGFYSIGDNAYFWSVTVNLGRALDKNDEFVYISNAPIGQGNSVRCLRDTGSVTTAMIPTLTTTVDSIKSTTARSGGNITSDGGATVTERGVVWSTSSTPTISLSTKSSIGTGTGSFTSHITGLSPNTTYYVRAYATNSVGTGYGNEVSFTTIQGLPCPGAPIVTDIDGNEYNTVSIGTQCWTKENIRVTKYNDGTAIPLDTSGGILGIGVGETWSSLTTGARSIYGHSENNIPSYGYLYNWFAATDAKGLCPSGWHLPTEAEWIELKNFLGGSIQAAYNMKAVGTTHWNNTDINVTNESGFTALAGGYRHPFDSGNSKGFDGFGTAAFYWSNVGYSYIGEGNTGVKVNNNINGLDFGSGSLKKLGVSVRCLKDAISSNNSTIPTLSTIMVDSISSSTVRSGGNIVSDGGDSVTIRGVVWSIKPNPTISAPSKTWNGTGAGLFISRITNLSPNTTYYLRAYAINNTGVSYGNELTFLTSSAVNQGVPCSGLPTISDIDGNTYNTVAIGSQCWTRENLKVSRYNDGTIIPFDSSGGVLGDSTGHTWGARTIGARTVYGQDSFNLQTYGYLYNWYAAKGIFESDTTNLKNLCPTGWHVPTDGEWTLLSDYLGGESIAGNKVKTTGTAQWIFPNTGSTNESGFSALPGGFRTFWGSFGSLNDDAYFASSSSYDSDFSWFRYLSNNSSNLGRYYSIGNTKKSTGASVRCLKDSISTPSTTLPTLTTTAVDSIKSTTARSGGNITSDGGCSITARGVVWSTSQNPTISLSTKTSDGTGTGSFTSNLTGLIANTTYYVRAYATNCVGTAYGSEVSFTTAAASQGVPCPGVPTVTDIEGNTYNTVQIGTQCWTKENLRVTKYSDGTIIPLDSSGGTTGNGSGQTWGSRTAGARKIYGHSQANLMTYGYLYNWYAAKGIATSGSTSYKNICPTGWHVPSDGEWTALTTFLGGESIAGGKIKSTGTTLWTSPNTGATNESGFTGLPGGGSSDDGSFNFIRSYAYFLSSTENGNFAHARTLLSDGSYVFRGNSYLKQGGFSVRCLRDFVSTPTTTLPTLTTTAADSIKSTTARSGGNITSDGGCTITARGVVWSTSQNPTIALSTKTSDGTGTGSFSSNLTGLIANTTYYVRAYATNCAGTAYGSEVTFTTAAASQGVPCPGLPTVMDIDGNTYNTVQIGEQCWTKENLRVTKYSDGTSIPLDNSGGTTGDGSGQTWESRTTGARTIYEHSASNLTTYGYLYNWDAAKGITTSGSTSYKNVCLTGWHVPSDGEWTTLTTFLGGKSIAGGKMKSTGTTLWASPNTGATNESGFTGLPGGNRNSDGSFNSISYDAYFWSATESSSNDAWYRTLNSNNGNVGRFIYGNRSIGASVRCLKN